MTLSSKTEKNGIARFLRRNGMVLLCAAGLFALVYQIVMVFRTGDSDYIDHISWAMMLDSASMIDTFRSGATRLWHICVRLTVMLGVKNIWKAAAIVTAAADAAAFLIAWKFWDKAIPERFPRWLLQALMLCVFLAGSLTVPGQTFYVGRGAVNTWHNPTNIMVRPFAAAVFYMTVNIYNRRRYGRHEVLPDPEKCGERFRFAGGFWAEFRTPVFTRGELVLYPVCLLLSVYAKPSFLQFFAPAIFLFLLFDVFRTKGMLLPFCAKLALAFLPAAVIICRQYFYFFGYGIDFAAAPADTAAASVIAGLPAAVPAVKREASLLIYFLSPSFFSAGDFLVQTARALFQTIYPCAFPFFVFLISCRRPKGAVGRLSLVCLGVALLEELCIHETGARASHGNFTWGYYLATWLLWTAAMGVFARLLREKGPVGTLARWGGSALLLWHLTCGVCYVSRILQTGLNYF